jgi:hypothetical protein
LSQEDNSMLVSDQRALVNESLYGITISHL